ncbi:MULTISPECIES: DUF2752 domain-containing protein [Amycolatopsis]|uniref:DUF2752 domain-containing protein n=1 Tax=Amycolatopsis echigonensis TaxID=2576905 RepID=A0A2N3WL74_9PSEU|nr:MULTISPECIES: DUF2752 domain-containing protein [Amycolatopsis]MBB2499926.1 DUF2752 domain-containing protein [Amycolatopsis echigonensis]MCG3751156.1 DUF2752 domain-containing protein [Amycolatopsis sp. Poz14]PKV94618.1 uncharacterized protein DUF2752 [Amycolatopsis niigatensis]
MATRVEWSVRDSHRPWTLCAVVASAAAVGLRVAGLPPVDVHGPLHYLGVMDPLCGGTRAAFLLLSGDAAGAARYNPIVFPLAAIAAGLLVRAGIGVACRRWLEIRLPAGWRRALLAALAVAVALLWIRQQAEADLLTRAWAGAGVS